MRISYWISDVCSTDRSTLKHERSGIATMTWSLSMFRDLVKLAKEVERNGEPAIRDPRIREELAAIEGELMSLTYSTYRATRSEEHTSELQSLMRISYAVFGLKKKLKINKHKPNPRTTAHT